MRLDREMGLTPAEFLRTLPAALGHDRYVVEGDDVFIEDPAGPIRIRLQPADPRRIAMLEVPVTRVEMEFGTMEEVHRVGFLARLETYFRRGGG